MITNVLTFFMVHSVYSLPILTISASIFKISRLSWCWYLSLVCKWSLRLINPFPLKQIAFYLLLQCCFQHLMPSCCWLCALELVADAESITYPLLELSWSCIAVKWPMASQTAISGIQSYYFMSEIPEFVFVKFWTFDKTGNFLIRTFIEFLNCTHYQ